MSASQQSGEIYFIGEKDLRAKKLTNYYKVGIVRENMMNLDRDSTKRMLEHQTGNPRELYIESVQITDLVEHVETLLHKQFAPLGVRGEWMQLNPSQLDAVKASARKLAQEAKTISADLLKIDELAGKKSNDVILKPTKKMSELHQAYLLNRAKVSTCEDIQEQIKTTLASALAELSDEFEEVEVSPKGNKKTDVKQFAKLQERKGRTVIDYEGFASKYPKLYAKYVKKTKSIKATATFEGVRGLDIDFRVADPAFSSVIARFEPLLKKVQSGKSQLQQLHEYSLEIRPLQMEAEWLVLKCETQLKVACGTNAAISGILKWSRVEKESEVIDKKGMLAKYPEQFQEFTSLAAPTRAVIVDPKRGY